MRRVARGDAAAVRVLVDRHLGPLTRFATRMLGEPSDAEDVAQEAFVRLWKQAGSWTPRASVSTWLYRVAHNLCVDRLRSRRVRAAASPGELRPVEPEPGAEMEQRQTEHAVRDALAELPVRQRAAISLVYYQELRNHEAAEVMGVHIDALESLLARARRKLRERLGGAPQPGRGR